MKIPPSRRRCRQKDEAEFSHCWNESQSHDEIKRADARGSFHYVWMHHMHIGRILDRYWEGELTATSALEAIKCIIEGRSE